MRKHNRKFAQRWSRESGDRGNFPQTMAHSVVNNKSFQLAANSLLRGLIRKVV